MNELEKIDWDKVRKNFWKDIECIEKMFEGKPYIYAYEVLNTLKERLERNTIVAYIDDKTYNCPKKESNE